MAPRAALQSMVFATLLCGAMQACTGVRSVVIARDANDAVETGRDAVETGRDATDALAVDANDALDTAIDTPRDTALDARDDAFDGPADRIDAPADEGQDAFTFDVPATATVRIMAANLTSGSNQSYTPGEGIRIFQGLRPDVVLIQEFNYATNSALDLRAFVNTAFGTTFQFVRGSGAIPNGVISRYPILASGEWFDAAVANRTFVWARIDVPGARDLWAVSLHLLSSSGTSRASEAMAVVSQLSTNAPDTDLVVVGGDFNTTSRTEGSIVALGSAVVTGGPYPVDQANNDNTNSTRAHPYDWVLADPDLQSLEVPVVIGTNSFAHGLVFDSRVYTPLGDVAPVLMTDSGASGMQHMGVLRDFFIGTMGTTMGTGSPP